MNTKKNLLGMSLSELTEFVVNLNMPKFRGKQIADWIYNKNILDINQFSNFSIKDRNLLSENATIEQSFPIKVVVSKDGTKKYLFSVDGGFYIEVAYIPEEKRNTLCVSSQVGCRMGCKFCMTEKQSLQRSLTAYEIVNQVFSIPERDDITNIVYMGMGEPLDNYDEVTKSLEILTSEWGLKISPSKVTLSTIGVIPNLKRFLNESECNLALSVHNPISDERTSFMPVERAYPLEDVFEVIRSVPFEKRRKFSVEYILFSGLNDEIRHVKKLVKLLHGTRVKVNLIPYHSIPGENFIGVNREKMEWFKDELKKRGIVTTIRKSRGQDIDAACGLLSTKEGN
ncbi:MAG: 23S rRNA (adenine(2503)-C(2))-methyltransferase [Spirochaetaceae bacterium 4572_7]|nr:MAG: 23S rRNA (adenine(2503)-C(2))-methyltransferase [Spirochaetaceae bacterium 4572_7]